MVIDPSVGFPLLRGVLFGLLGIGFWVAGLVVVNYLWKRWRNDDQSGDGDPPGGGDQSGDGDPSVGGDQSSDDVQSNDCGRSAGDDHGPDPPTGDNV